MREPIGHNNLLHPDPLMWDNDYLSDVTVTQLIPVNLLKRSIHAGSLEHLNTT